MKLSLSIIVPVYNRPKEIDELLESLTKQTYKGDYEVIIVEDGSQNTSEKITQKHKDLNVKYLYKPNTGPGDSRNFGMRKASGNYFIILDSDVILPNNYLETLETFLNESYVDCFGGSDAAHENFTTLQKAINYVMTSFFTTGGIRGGRNRVQKFEPRSFNMGISKDAFVKTNGFSRIHPGEDPDLSRRIEKAGFKTAFLPEAHVFHKRRISWDKFYTQVKKFGTVRPILSSWHPKTKKLTFWFPTMFVFFTLGSVLATFVVKNIWFIVPLLSYLFVLLIHSTLLNKSLKVGFWSIYAVFIQFFGYGIAFLKSTFYIRLLKRDPEKQFPHYFFKKNEAT